MRAHYYPDALARYDIDGSDLVERGVCGTWLGETSMLSGDWNCVDCKRCIKHRQVGVDTNNKLNLEHH